MKKNKIIYDAFFVMNSDELLNLFPTPHINKFGHHMTICYKPTVLTFGENRLGWTETFKIKGRLTTDKVDVLIIEDCNYSTNDIAHITLSCAENITPSISNSELQLFKSDIKYFKTLDISIEMKYGYFNGAKAITSKI